MEQAGENDEYVTPEELLILSSEGKVSNSNEQN